MIGALNVVFFVKTKLSKNLSFLNLKPIHSYKIYIKHKRATENTIKDFFLLCLNLILKCISKYLAAIVNLRYIYLLIKFI